MKKILLLILSFVFAPVLIKAENKIYFEKQEINLLPGEIYDINIKVDSDADFTKIDFDIITTSDQIKFDNIKINDKFVNNTNKGYSLKSNTPQKSGTVIATLTIRSDTKSVIGSSGLIRIVNPKLTSNTYSDLDSNELVVNIKEDIKSNYLKNLSSAIAPFDFNKEKFEYEVEVDDNVKKFDLVAIPEDENAMVNISSQKLDKRKNIINVRVSRETLLDKTYKVTVIKKTNEDISKKIVRNSKGDKKNSLTVKKKWISIIFVLVSVFIVNLFFLKKWK